MRCTATPARGNDTCVTSHANPQVVYSEPMAALRTRTLLACNRPIDALAAMEVHYEAPTCVRGAAWRVWLGVQARYLQGDLTVRGGVEQPLPGSRARVARVAVGMQARCLLQGDLMVQGAARG